MSLVTLYRNSERLIEIHSLVLREVVDEGCLPSHTIIQQK
jgi:hypothetical protein